MPAPGASPIDSVTLPRHPSPPQRAPFPLLAVLAPLAGAAALFAITRSPMMIAFAALSPVIAIASTIDGRVAARRRRRSEARVYRAARERFLDDVALAHARERALLGAAHPGADALMTDPAHRARRWAASTERFVPVRIGTGSAPSTLPVSGTADTDEDRDLLAVCRIVDGAPVLVDPTAGIGIVAPAIIGRALVRGLVAQLSDAHPPGVLAITAPSGDVYDWLDDYPHAAQADAEHLRLHIVDDHPDAAERTDAARPAPESGPSHPLELDSRARDASFGRRTMTAVLALAADVDGLPTGCGEVLEVDAAGRINRLSSPGAPETLRGELVTARSTALFGDDLASAALSRGVTGGRSLPDTVALADLSDTATSEPTDGLPAAIGVTATGPLVLDLVASGPHAIVTGTTGSGKSELLISWVLGMASCSAPDRVNFLLVDFKGGTAFARLSALPHTVGVVTDLGHGEADRALKSLRAELRRREAVLADLGIADVHDSDAAPARLVIVVDEAAAMLAAFPDLAGLFADVAARGRALGVHLILGTQRATGVLADGLLANCALRVSLRLSSESDSTALLGTDAAARLPHAVPGRLVVVRDGELVTAQAATADPSDVSAVAAKYPMSTPVRPPWLPALPERIPLTAFAGTPAGSVVLGALDDPDRQIQEGIVYRPQAEHLLVLGVRGAGKTGALVSIAAQWRSGVLWVPGEIEGAWDAFEWADSILHSGSREPLLVLIDDLDALLARFGDVHREEMLDRVRSLLVDGPRAGIAVVCSAAVLPSGLRSVAGHFGERLVLRQADRQEHVLAGAAAEFYDQAAPPGRGVWRGLLAQVVLVEDEAVSRQETSGVGPRVSAVERLAFPAGTTTIVVSRAPGVVARRLRASAQGLRVVELADVREDSFSPQADAPVSPTAIAVRAQSEPMAIVGDADAWQSRWQLMTRLRRDGSIVFDGCTLAQVRGILHSRVLPPATLPGHALIYTRDGEFRRVTVPE
ncbi:FtsK/SpoIIIE domain-containing protein [Humibacter sp. RRB41]|uniref:FtsK/SpoIIIE domain-containing protein n=1 Tax=Humibacter sp. RRB41 TaxID=2919946 RepID=UPI001FAA5530|nr:FtsK/SpoIIIE domain-containing protein [Humibacter sp. RRB41]